MRQVIRKTLFSAIISLIATVFTGSRYIGNSNQVTSVEECKGKFVARK